MERVILHCDANAFYASVECLYTPSIRQSPVAVCGSVEERHGIVLTKNQIAKQFGVQTGEAIWQARKKCPDLICVPPDYALYIRFSRRMRRLYEEYSDRVESFGLDEAWIDLSNPGLTIRDGERIAHEIRLRVKRELGITVSVGVSFNKIFAKLGSDMKKPDAVTVIPPDSFRDVVWPLPVGDLLFVGPATRRKLADMNVRTIGDLARSGKKMQESIRRQVEYDEMTQLYNRRYGDKNLLKMKAQMQISGIKYCVAIGDIDFFKKVNDNYGHEAGDEVLIHVARVLKEQLLANGFVCRWGGEEFLIVIESHTIEQAEHILQSILDTLRNQTITYQEQQIRVTMSMGLVSVKAEDEIDDILRCADQKLYEAKENGRDQIRC